MEGLVPLWITSGASAIGVVYAIIRNGSRNRKQDYILKTELKAELNHIQEKLDDPNSGLGAIKKSADGMRLHCAEVSTRIESQVKTNTDEINILRKGKQ